jgi:hypothetical protein
MAQNRAYLRGVGAVARTRVGDDRDESHLGPAPGTRQGIYLSLTFAIGRAHADDQHHGERHGGLTPWCWWTAATVRRAPSPADAFPNARDPGSRSGRCRERGVTEVHGCVPPPDLVREETRTAPSGSVAAARRGCGAPGAPPTAGPRDRTGRRPPARDRRRTRGRAARR